jgi:hypothetical protein
MTTIPATARSDRTPARAGVQNARVGRCSLGIEGQHKHVKLVVPGWYFLKPVTDPLRIARRRLAMLTVEGRSVPRSEAVARGKEDRC